MSGSTVSWRRAERASTSTANGAMARARTPKTATSTARAGPLEADEATPRATAVPARVTTRARLPKNRATNTVVGTRKRAKARLDPVPWLHHTSTETATVHHATSSPLARTSTFRIDSRITQIAAVATLTTTTPVVRTAVPVSPMIGQATVARAKRTRSTESGLRSSRGASRANHERVFGNRRFFGRADEDRRALVTGWAGASARSTQPRQVASLAEPDPIPPHRHNGPHPEPREGVPGRPPCGTVSW